MTHVALLRAINVGKGRTVPMAALVEIFTSARCREVRTYIQSGNVIFSAPDAVAKRVPAVVAQAVHERFGFEVPVLTRSAAELHALAKKNPFLRAGADPATLHVAFLAEKPAAPLVAALDPARSPPDAFTVLGREIYLCCPGGYGKTKLTNAWFDARLRTASTVRNWRTVLELTAMAS